MMLDATAVMQVVVGYGGKDETPLKGMNLRCVGKLREHTLWVQDEISSAIVLAAHIRASRSEC